MKALDSQAIDRLLTECIARGDFPGAVAIVGHAGEIVYWGTFGHRMIVPQLRPMLGDTIFDLASLTKPLATAPAILQLVEQGKLSLQDPVARFLPEFTGDGRDSVTVQHLLTHSSGLPAYKNYLSTGMSPAEIFADLCRLPLQAPPGTQFIYSCLGYMLLREIVGIVAGQRLDAYCAKHLFEPLGMSETIFNPPPELHERCAATEKLSDRVLCAEVHDENARALEGVGGNAGLFATAADVARFCQMVLNLGELDGVRVLSPALVRRSLLNHALHPGDARGLGWDIDTGYSPVVRGDVFPPGGFGHSGYTGTSIWIDPPSQTYVVLLTNRCHPTREGVANNARRGIANIVGAAYAKPSFQILIPPASGPVLTGLDRLAREGSGILAGRRVGLITNHSAITRERRHAIEVLRELGVAVHTLFSPEHGLHGDYDELMKVPSSVDEATGLPVHSLYSTIQRPSEEMLAGLDMLVFDIADVGVRYYTYTTTMTYCMEEAAKYGLSFVVLDRPNPINGVDVEGSLLDPPFRGLSAYHPIPVRHGMTAGELARFANKEYGIGCDLEVIECIHWDRRMWFDETGLPWVNPSPNLRSLTQATLYPVICPIEAANISVGRGTDSPFEVFGAPYLNGEQLAQELNAAQIPHLRFVPISFVPQSHKHAGERCGGCFVFTTNRRALQPVRASVTLASVITRLAPEQFDVWLCRHLFGSDRIVEAIKALDPPEHIVANWATEEEAFRKRRQAYLIY
ncbi:MAG: exo-beta-N-acetylmuramidase NamZ domain-containing protein [Candidatus Zipacnadales bacterium]